MRDGIPGARGRAPSSSLAAALALALAAGCARTGAPPGGDEDYRPPEVRSTRPDSFAVVEPFREPVRIRFDERISERPTTGRLGDAVLVSPRTSELRVEHARDALEVELIGGFGGGLVYTVTLLPRIQDMFGNPLRAPHTLVFSTGPEIPPTLLAGYVVDRITGNPTADILVDAVAVPDSTVYTARTDDEGVFTIRHLPAGTYRVFAYQDRDRNLSLGDFEPRDTARARLAAADTALVTLRLLQPDSTAAVLARVEVEDSLAVRLAFDDYLPARRSTEGIRVRIRREGPAPGVDSLLAPAAFEEWIAARRAAADSARAAADSAAADTAAAAADSLPPVADTAAVADTAGARAGEGVRPPEGVRGEEAPAGVREARAGEEADTTRRAPPAGPLPVRELFAILDAPLEGGRTYEVEVSGVTNVTGIPGGGGTASFSVPEVEPPPEDSAAAADTAARDTAAAEAAASDTAARDTAAVGDTTTAPADTAGAPADSAAAPDTGAAPDSAGVGDSVGVGDTTTARAESGLRGLVRLRSRIRGLFRLPPRGR